MADSVGTHGALLVLIIGLKQDELNGHEAVFSNKEIMSLIGVKCYKHFSSIRAKCVSSGFLKYTFKSKNEAGSYSIPDGTIGSTHLYGLDDYRAQTTNSVGVQTPIRPVQLGSRRLQSIIKISKDINIDSGVQTTIGPTRPTDWPTVSEIVEAEFEHYWPKLRKNSRSNKAQSFANWRTCRKKYLADQILAAWENKIKETYPDPNWICGFQVFAKIDNVKDCLENKSIASNNSKQKTDAELMQEFLKPLAE